MKTGISLKVVSDFNSELWGLPPPSKMRWLSSSSGVKILNILYHFEYNPQSWREWQRVASIKMQIQERVPKVEFVKYDPLDEVERVYTVAELGKHFLKHIKYHKPLYPNGKDEFMRSLTIYAMRLHYEEMLHYEAIIAMALHFNTKCDCGYSFRELNRKARAILELDRDEWRVKLSDKARYEKASQSGVKSGEIRREKAKPKKELAKRLRDEGMTLKAISEILGVSFSTVRRYKLDE